MQTGNVNEKELFVARFVLLKLACGRVQDARGLIDEYAPKLNYQIIHFIRKNEKLLTQFHSYCRLTYQSCRNKK